MDNWIDEITEAFRALGGITSLAELYAYIRANTLRELIPKWTATVRRTIEDHSSDSKNYRAEDVFFAVNGLGNGVWGLRELDVLTPEAEDYTDMVPPERIEQTTYRILRDTRLAREIKRLHNFRCQLCGQTVEIGDGQLYAEAHHIQPLGQPHNGPDEAGNILCLCPVHHVQVDYGAIALNLQNLILHPKHSIHEAYIDYHNSVIIR